ncbi:uncharacterized protein LOC119383993 [Rhipicephalus sanguineus]|uniref:uncharacterized protein LOC119383993 n=1 Tax=Rhipicephalus sanguineus TaxID=34632 RepID=UPI0018962C9B|nr:uncharacterized protein LOC119383993 [Rhipicephalus sanguineus]
MATGGVQAAIEPFSGKNWSSWIQRLTFYFVANDVCDEQKKRALLLTLCGADTFETACALVAPKTPGEVGYADIVALLQKHFDPRPSELYSRYVFQRRDQRPEESISNYVAALRSLSADCNFGVPATTSVTSTPPAEGHAAVLANPTMLPQDVMLRDRFVCGIRDEHLQQRLFAEKDLTFQRALDLALSSESASKQQRGLKGATSSAEVHKTSQSKKESKHSAQQRRCYRCDGWHEADTCKFRTAQCRFCSKKGHIENACISKKKKNKEGNLNARQGTHMVNAQPVCYDLEDTDRCYDLHAVSGRQPCPKFLVDVKVEGRPLKFEVDTGAACSLISEATYHQTWPANAPKLSREPLDLRTWSGEELDTVGSAQVRVRFKSKDYVLPLLVMKGTGCNLLGRDWFSALNIRVHGINQVAEPSQEIQEVLARHPDVFKEGIDGYVGPLVHLDLEEGATPKFCKARPVPLAYQEPMEEELDRLSTVNAVVKKTAYPLPTTAEVFAKLRGGTTFSTLDLYQAYQQLRVDDETAALLTVNTTKELFKVDEPCSPGDVLMLASAPRFELSPRQLAELTRNDPLLSRVMTAVSNGELRRLPKQEFSAFTKLGHELSLQEGCVIRGARLVVPEKARKDVLDLAHRKRRRRMICPQRPTPSIAKLRPGWTLVRRKLAMTNPAGPRSTKLHQGPNVIGVHLTDTVTPSKG